jgi:hypothetical protein
MPIPIPMHHHSAPYRSAPLNPYTLTPHFHTHTDTDTDTPSTLTQQALLLTNMRTTSSHLCFGRLVFVALGMSLLHPAASRVFNCTVVYTNLTQVWGATSFGLDDTGSVLAMANDDRNFCQPLGNKVCGRLALSTQPGDTWSEMG